MAFGDYELIHTKRVNRERRNVDILRSRYFEAKGGYSTLIMTLLFGAMG